MTTLFSFAFSGLFLAFIVAAVLGHVLLIDALMRPFFGRTALGSQPLATKSSLLSHPAH